MNTFDYYFKSLNLIYMEPIDKNSAEFKTIETYTCETHGKTHFFRCAIESVFRVERSVGILQNRMSNLMLSILEKARPNAGRQKAMTNWMMETGCFFGTVSS